MKIVAALVGLAAGLATAIAIGYIQLFIDAAAHGLTIDLGGQIIKIGERYPPWIAMIIVIGLVAIGAALFTRVNPRYRQIGYIFFAVGLVAVVATGWVVAGTIIDSPIAPERTIPQRIVVAASASQAVFLLIGGALVPLWRTRVRSAAKSPDSGRAHLPS